MEEIILTGAIDEQVEEDVGAQEVEKGVQKQFQDILYNQTEVNAYACTIVATYTALSNLTGKVVDYDTMRSTLARMENDGKFRRGFGAKLSDGVDYALADFNSKFGTSYKKHLIYVSASSLYEALKFSPVVSGIYYGKAFVPDTQDNAWIDGALSDVKGTQGHAICYVKINTEDDHLVKFANSYAGRLAKNVVGFDLNEYRPMCFNSAYFFSK